MNPIFVVTYGTLANRRIVTCYYSERAAIARARALGGEVVATSVADEPPAGLSVDESKELLKRLKACDPASPERALYYLVHETSVMDIADGCDVDSSVVVGWIRSTAVAPKFGPQVLLLEARLRDRVDADEEHDPRWNKWRSTGFVRRVRGEFEQRRAAGMGTTNEEIAKALGVGQLDVKNALRNMRKKAKP